MTIKQDCQRLFKTDNLYKVLNLEKSDDLTEGKVKKAYYKASLLYHPDKAPVEGDKSESTEKFQILSKVYTILVDKDKRDFYDDSGEVPSDLVFESNFDWYNFWRNLYKISTDDIKSFEESYKGSAEEKADLKRHYNDGDGSVDYIIDNLLCAGYEDEDRLVKLLKEMIAGGEIEDNPNFSKEPAKKKKARKVRAEKEAKEAAKAEQSQSNGQSSLEDTIKAKAAERNAELVASLEEKYSGKVAVKGKAEGKKGAKGKGKKGGGEASEEPTPEPPKSAEPAESAPVAAAEEPVAEVEAPMEPPAKRGRGRAKKTASAEEKVVETTEEPKAEISATVEPVNEDKTEPIEIEVDNNPVAAAPSKKAGRPPKGAKKADKPAAEEPQVAVEPRKTRAAGGLSPKKNYAEMDEPEEPDVPAPKRGRTARAGAKEPVKAAEAEEKPGRKTRGVVVDSPKKAAEPEKVEEAEVPAKKSRGGRGPPANAKVAGKEESADEGTSAEGKGADPAEPEVAKEKGKRGRPKKAVK